MHFAIDPATTLLTGVAFRPSPNCDLRPSETEISLLVIHGISLPPGEFGGSAVDDLFHNQLDACAHPYFASIVHLRVSAHVLIRRDGAVVQYVPFKQRAWHAGKSTFNGRENCNDFSIGIELEGADDIPYTALQYQCLASLTKALMLIYSQITPDHIVGHSDIAPQRKTDPGPAFDWLHYHQLLKDLAKT